MVLLFGTLLLFSIAQSQPTVITEYNISTQNGTFTDYWCNATNCYQLQDFLIDTDTDTQNTSSYNASYEYWDNSTLINTYNASYEGAFNESYEYWDNASLINTYNATYDAYVDTTNTSSYNASYEYWDNSSLINTYNATYDAIEVQPGNDTATIQGVINYSDITLTNLYITTNIANLLGFNNLTKCSGTEILKMSGGVWVCGNDLTGAGGGGSGLWEIFGAWTSINESTGASPNINITDMISSSILTDEFYTHDSTNISLSNLGNPVDDVTYNFGSNSMSFSWTNPSGQPTYDGAFEFQASGAFTGDLVHIHQHTGNPGTTNLLRLETEDSDVTPLNISTASLYSIYAMTGTAFFNEVNASKFNMTDLAFNVSYEYWNNVSLIRMFNASYEYWDNASLINTYNATYDAYVDTDTSADTECAGTTTYMDGEGGCDDISTVYEEEAHCAEHDGAYLDCNVEELDVDAVSLCAYCGLADTNAGTICGVGEFLNGDTSCDPGFLDADGVDSAYNSSYEYWDNSTLINTYNATYDGAVLNNTGNYTINITTLYVFEKLCMDITCNTFVNASGYYMNGGEQWIIHNGTDVVIQG